MSLARRQPAKAAATASIILLGSLAVTFLLATPALGLAAMVLLFLSTREFFFPLRYRLTEQGAWVEGLMLSSFIPWEKVRACYPTGDGVKLSPLSRPSRLEAYRGVYLKFAGNRQQVLDLVGRLAANRRPPE